MSSWTYRFGCFLHERTFTVTDVNGQIWSLVAGCHEGSEVGRK
jgi:hypothetical protein